MSEIDDDIIKSQARQAENARLSTSASTTDRVYLARIEALQMGLALNPSDADQLVTYAGKIYNFILKGPEIIAP